VVLSELNSVYKYAEYPTVALTDNRDVMLEYDNVIGICPFPTSYNDLPVIRNTLLEAS